jgi:hypothetical protein
MRRRRERCDGRFAANLLQQRRGRLPRLDAADRCTSRADRLDIYLRDAQAYMLISMPTGTSTIFGVFQLIHSSQGFQSRTCS